MIDVMSGFVAAQGELYAKWKKKTRKEIGGASSLDADEDLGAMPNRKVNTKVKDELRTATEIRKIQATEENLRLKNMPKEKRRKIEAKMRQTKKQQQQHQLQTKMQLSAGGPRRRSKIIMRV